jgi:AcrR family transcriptional regulator
MRDVETQAVQPVQLVQRVQPVQPVQDRRTSAMAQNDSISKLAPRQIVALECLMTRTEDETLEQVASRAGVSRRTMHRYLRDASFHAEYRSRVIMEIGSQRGRMASALVKGGTTPGPGQAAMQKIYWTMLGELKDLLAMELTGRDGGPIEVGRNIDLDRLSMEDKRALVELLERVGVLTGTDSGIRRSRQSL